MRKAALAVIAVLFLVLMGLSWTLYTKDKAQALAEERQRLEREHYAETEEAQSQNEDTIEQDLIRAHKQFAVCSVRELELGREPRVDSGQCKLRDPDNPVYTDTCYYETESQYGETLEFLVKAGYIRIWYYPTQYPNIPSDLYQWVPRNKGLAALGGDIREEKVGYYRNGMVAYKWNLVLGCRELVQVDAATPLADGVKVDFSWRWKPTDLGIADGLSDARQRGVAYFTRTGTGLNIDQIQFGSENTP